MESFCYLNGLKKKKNQPRINEHKIEWFSGWMHGYTSEVTSNAKYQESGSGIPRSLKEERKSYWEGEVQPGF